MHIWKRPSSTRLTYIKRYIGGSWRYDPHLHGWVCADGRRILRLKASDGVHFEMFGATGESLGNVDRMVRAEITPAERRARMIDRDRQALEMRRRGMTYPQIAQHLTRLGPNSEFYNGGPRINKERARRIVLRAMAREHGGGED